MATPITNVANAPRNLACQPVGGQASDYEFATATYSVGELVRWTDNVSPPVNYVCVQENGSTAPLTEENPSVYARTPWSATSNYVLGSVVSYPLTGTRYNWLVVGATTLGTPPPSTPVSSGPWQYLSTVGTQNTAYWVAVNDGEPFWNSGVQYYAGDVVSYTESATPPVLYLARVNCSGTGAKPSTFSSYWKRLGSGGVNSVNSLTGNLTVVSGTGVDVNSSAGSNSISLSTPAVLSVLAGAGLSVSGTNTARTFAVAYGVATVTIPSLTPQTSPALFDVDVPGLTSATGIVLLGAPQGGVSLQWRIGPAVGDTGAFFLPAPPAVFIPDTSPTINKFQISWTLQSPADPAMLLTLNPGTVKIPYVVLHL